MTIKICPYGLPSCRWQCSHQISAFLLSSPRSTTPRLNRQSTPTHCVLKTESTQYIVYWYTNDSIYSVLLSSPRSTTLHLYTVNYNTLCIEYWGNSTHCVLIHRQLRVTTLCTAFKRSLNPPTTQYTVHSTHCVLIHRQLNTPCTAFEPSLHSPESDPPHKIMRYRFYYSI